MPNTNPQYPGDGQTAAQPKIKPLPTPEEFAAFMRGETLPEKSIEVADAVGKNPDGNIRFSSASGGKLLENSSTNSDEPQVNEDPKRVPTETTEDDDFKPLPYPKDGQLHVRLGQPEWDILQRLCKRRRCSLANAVNLLLRYFDHYPTDLEATIDYLEVFDLHTDIIEAQVEDLVESAHRVEQLLRVEATGATPTAAHPNGNNSAQKKGT